MPLGYLVAKAVWSSCVYAPLALNHESLLARSAGYSFYDISFVLPISVAVTCSHVDFEER